MKCGTVMRLTCVCEGQRNVGDYKGKVLCQGAGTPTRVCHRLVENVVKIGGDKQCSRAGAGLQLKVEVRVGGESYKLLNIRDLHYAWYCSSSNVTM